MRTALEIVFWLSCGLIVWTQVGYAAALAVLARVFARATGPLADAARSPPAQPSAAGPRRQRCR